jgi:hypothetical protein
MSKYYVSAYEVMYNQKVDHAFLYSKEEVCQCWTVPKRLKVTNDPEFTEYACKNYIIDDDKICDYDAKGYFSDGLLPSDKKEEESDEFDHLQDDITEDNHVEDKEYNPFNKFDAESKDNFVDPVCNVLAVSNAEGTKQSILKTLSKKNLAKITTSDVPMNQWKSPPERLIDQSTTQKISLMLPSTNLSTTLVVCSYKKNVQNQSSESSEEDSEEGKISSKKPKTTKTLEALCTKTTFDLQSSSSS